MKDDMKMIDSGDRQTEQSPIIPLEQSDQHKGPEFMGIKLKEGCSKWNLLVIPFT